MCTNDKIMYLWALLGSVQTKTTADKIDKGQWQIWQGLKKKIWLN